MHVRFVYASRCLGLWCELPRSGCVQGCAYFGGVEASEAAEVLHGDEGPGGFAGGLAGAAHEPLGGIVAAAGEGRHVFGVKADAGHGDGAGYVGTDRVIWGTALGLSNLLEVFRPHKRRPGYECEL